MPAVTAPHGLCRLAPVRGSAVDWGTAVELDVQPVRPQADRPPLTARQRRMLTFIGDYIDQHGYPPSVREIGAGTGLKALGSVLYQLGQLEAKGAIERPPGDRRSRALRLVQGVA
jgi:repressor LexA